ncbi:hypothetical protein KDW_29450 [Dictyobacter vulcani]|uniref:Response regulatory domain-containing protein n=1 Tax=Dictyobacter vulcani TaxID=2607529 RepID=A0A5J4KLW4_9CHLR|nr:response regulator [Dictyobacter vulcani]GER88783.1 hypothetical protein KDW_29450 [Dictyobacter vulcani]
MATTPKVLIIDDSSTQCLFMQQSLRSAGYQVVVANDGKQGLRIIAQENPQCVVLDIVLPGMNGFEVCRYLRSQDAWRTLPVIMISSKNSSSDRFWAMRQGANAYLTKPFKANELVEAVQENISERPRTPNTSVRPPVSQRPLDPHTPLPATRQDSGAYRPVDVQAPFASVRNTPGRQRPPTDPFAVPVEQQAMQNQHSQGIPLSSNSRAQQFAFPPLNVPGKPETPTPSGATGPQRPAATNPIFPLLLLVPKRIDYVDPPRIADPRTRQLYQIIDGQKNVEMLRVLTNMTKEELLSTLRQLVRQQHIHLYEPGGRLIDSNI